MKINRITKRVCFVALFSALISAACQFAPVTKQEYRQGNLAFTHFSNWKITADETTKEAVGDVRLITVEGPNDTIFIATGFPSDVATTLEEYAELLHKESNEGAKEVTGGFEVVKMEDAATKPVAAQIAGETRNGLVREFDAKVLGMPVPHRVEYYMVEAGAERWFVVAQASKEDWEKSKNGFQTIFDSLSFGTATEAESGNRSSTPPSKKK